MPGLTKKFYYIHLVGKSRKSSTCWYIIKGETITRVNGNVSFFAGKRLQKS